MYIKTGVRFYDRFFLNLAALEGFSQDGTYRSELAGGTSSPDTGTGGSPGVEWMLPHEHAANYLWAFPVLALVSLS